MRRITLLCVVSAGAAALALTCAPPATAAAPIAPATCFGFTDIWTSQAGDDLWTTAGNWSANAVPGPNDIAVLPNGAVADNVELNSDATVCDLQIGAEASLLIDQAKTLTAQSAEITGGSAANADTSLNGQVSTTDLHIGSGYTVVAEADASTPVNETTSTFELDGGAHLTLTDAAVTLTVTGQASLGGSGGTAHFDSSSTSDGDDSAKFDADATVTLVGTVDSNGLDVITTPASVIDTAGHTWTVHGDAFSRFAAGTTIESSTAGGVYAIGSRNHVLVSGTTTIADGATLRLQTTGMITDGRYFQSTGAPSGTLDGAGVFAWTSGEFTGHVTLGPGLTTLASGSGVRHVSDPNKFGATVLTNAGNLTLQGGAVIVDGSLDSLINTGDVTVTGGHFAAQSADAPPIQNRSGGQWTVAPSSIASSKIAAGSFRNAGTLTIAPNKKLIVDNDFQQTSSGTTRFTVSSSTTASRIQAGTLLLAGTAHVSSAPGYAPLHATLTGLLRGGSRNGTFDHVISTTHRANTAWHLSYVAARVDAVLS